MTGFSQSNNTATINYTIRHRCQNSLTPCSLLWDVSLNVCVCEHKEKQTRGSRSRRSSSLTVCLREQAHDWIMDNPFLTWKSSVLNSTSVLQVSLKGVQETFYTIAQLFYEMLFSANLDVFRVPNRCLDECQVNSGASGHALGAAAQSVGTQSVG